MPAEPGITPDITDLDVLKPFTTSRAIALVRENMKCVKRKRGDLRNLNVCIRKHQFKMASKGHRDLVGFRQVCHLARLKAIRCMNVDVQFQFSV